MAALLVRQEVERAGGVVRSLRVLCPGEQVGPPYWGYLAGLHTRAATLLGSAMRLHGYSGSESEARTSAAALTAAAFTTAWPRIHSAVPRL